MKFTIAVLVLSLLLVTSQCRDADPSDITKVHLVFMNHLDVGFDGIHPELGFINNILNKYFHEYFPTALKVALELKALGYAETLVYTTHPWVVSMFVDCPPNLVLAGVKLQCPNKTEISNFEEAVKNGIITWHAGPMNMNNEMFDPSMVDFSLQISEDLDKRFGIKRLTRVVSQRDVPGMSKALLPLYAKHGIEGITVGVNGVSSPPAVPKIFRWKYQNASLIAMWHPGGYPNAPGHYPMTPGGLSSEDCVTVYGFNQALCFAFRSDNQGPPTSYSEVLLDYEIVRGQFPNAVVRGSTFESFLLAVQAGKPYLPEVTQEIGDTWIQGSASDPLKCAMMRAFFRARSECLAVGESCPNDARLYNASRFLTKLGEHTWGISDAGDLTNWENEVFYKFLENKTALYEQGPLSWIEQRQFNNLALDALQDHPLADTVRAEWKKLFPTQIDFTNFHEASDPTASFSCTDGYKYQFSTDGSLISLIDTAGNQWAGAENPLGQYIYQSYNQTDFDEFEHMYSYSNAFFLGIGKPNLNKHSRAESKTWPHKLNTLYQANDGSCKFTAFVVPVSSDAIYYYGASPKIYVSYVAVNNSGKLGFEITLQFREKPPTRMPEAIFFSFKPVPKTSGRWQIHKLGQMIDPFDVMQNGSQTQHGVDKGVYYTYGSQRGLEILSLDVPITNMLTSTSPLSAVPKQLYPLRDMSGVAFNIFNNVWNVNYIFWFPYTLDDMNQQFRFSLNFL